MKINCKQKNQGFIAHHYYANALEEYKKANNNEKIEQTAVLLEQAKKTIELKNKVVLVVSLIRRLQIPLANPQL